MFKNQLQELAQRSCFNLPSYVCIREGPDHAPRFKASVNFNGEVFESPTYNPTLRQAEHSAAEVALNVLSSRGPSRSLTARVLDETGIYKNLLQETAHRAGLNLPLYTTVRSGPGHVPIFTCTVELAGIKFTGDSAKTKKQAEKNAAIAAWSALKRMPSLDSLTNKEPGGSSSEDQEQAVVAKVLSSLRTKEDSSKQVVVRKRDYNNCSMARRRMVKGPSSLPSSSSASSSSSSSNLQQRCRILDLMLESAMKATAEKGKNSSPSFMSLLPPPPPRTTSKILPPISAIEKGKSAAEEEISSSYRVSSLFDKQEHPATTKGFIDRRSQQPPQLPTNYSVQSVVHMGRPIYTAGGGFFNHNTPPRMMAPAVHIRSVIPVCASPPPAARPQPPPTIGEAPNREVLSQPSPTEFNKKLQL
ncbi:Double-stranded RNA-binding protein 5 [Linum perenne]